MKNRTREDIKLERILTNKLSLANTLTKVKKEATRRAVTSGSDHIVCMDKVGNLKIRVGQDYLEEKRKLTALCYCFSNGNVSNVK